MKSKNMFLRFMNVLARHGVFGRKKQVITSLSWEKNAGFNVNKNEWEKFYHKIRKQYVEIRVHKLWSTRIGEYIARYLTAIEDAKENADKGILDVFVLSDCIEHNARLSQIMGRNIQIVDKSNIDMWIYILSRFPKVEFTKYWDEYAIKNNDRIRNANETFQYFEFTKEEKEEGEQKKRLMGLEAPFVCVASREKTYLDTIESIGDCSCHDYRDSDINKLSLSADYLAKKEITMVRIGRHVKDRVEFNNCIDYANRFYDELMDIYLMKECKFYVGDSAGVIWLPMVLNRPVAYKNAVPVFLDSETFPYNPLSLYIFKKYYSKKENRFLSVREMMQIEKKVRYDGNLYEKFGIEVIENSAEEILDLVTEINARIDGEWIDTPEYIELQKKYQTIYKEWCRQQHYNECATIRFNVGTMFLKKNPFLLS